MQQTELFLKDLDGNQIPIPVVGNISITKSLKKIPRSGKLLRLQSLEPKIPIRSIYDHILSVAYTADTLLPHLGIQISGNDKIELSRAIAYHDLCEIIIGDIPQYTPLNNSKRNRAQIMAQNRLSNFPDGYPEKIVTEFICLYLQDSERLSVKKAFQTMESQTNIKKLAYVFDKLDPIIATWRYIYLYRKQIDFSIDTFLDRMRAFFENPLVSKNISKKLQNEYIANLILKLQDTENARNYYQNGELPNDDGLFNLSTNVVKSLIEGRSFLFADIRGDVIG